MASLRKPLQGVWNIIRFNRHLFLLSLLLMIMLVIAGRFLDSTIYYWIALIVALSVSTSLLVSFYVYDLSGFYELEWLTDISAEQSIININAGFDEISALIHQKFSENSLMVLDFYDPALHTEISIKCARKAYSPYPGTIAVTTALMPLDDNSADKILLIFAAHEIRDMNERRNFLQQLSCVLKPDGEIIIIEHLRDIFNFLAYNIGFLHFVSRKDWYTSFQPAGFVVNERKINPFVTIFSLKKNGN